MPRFYGPGSSFATSGGTTSGVASSFTLNQLTYMSPLGRDRRSAHSVFKLGVVFFTYVGYVPAQAVIRYAEVFSNASPGTTALEIGVCSSANAPNEQATVVFTSIAASLTLSPVGGTNQVVRNNVAFDVTLANAAHCWGMIRMTGIGTASTPSSYVQIADDFQEGWCRLMTMSSSLASTTSFISNTIPPVPSIDIRDGVSPDIRIRLVHPS